MCRKSYVNNQENQFEGRKSLYSIIDNNAQNSPQFVLRQGQVKNLETSEIPEI